MSSAPTSTPSAAFTETAPRGDAPSKVMAIIVLILDGGGLLAAAAQEAGLVSTGMSTSDLHLPAWLGILSTVMAGVTVAAASFVLRRRRVGARIAMLALLLAFVYSASSAIYVFYARQNLAEAVLSMPSSVGAQQLNDPTARQITVTVIVVLSILVAVGNLLYHAVFAAVVNRKAALASYRDPFTASPAPPAQTPVS